MKSLHYNNSLKSKQDLATVGHELIKAIIETGERQIILSSDDGDGDVWVYRINVQCDRIDQVIQITEN
jgi:hypothetical protein